MQDIQKQIEDDVSKVIRDKNTLAAIDAAIEVGADYETKFHANWMIARGFYNLGIVTALFHAADRAIERIAKDPEELGCKMAFIDKDGRECIIIAGHHGYVFMYANGYVSIHSGYHCDNLDVLMALDGISLKQTFRDLMVQGLPFMGLIPILDSIVENRSNQEEMTRLHAKFRSYLA